MLRVLKKHCDDSLYMFKKLVFDKFKTDKCHLKKGYHSKENNMKIQYANEFDENLGKGDPTTCIYQFIYNEKDGVDTEIIQFFYA